MSVYEAHEHAERAEHAHAANDPFITRVSITIALLAVSAAIVGSLETVESAAAIRSSSQAVLFQDRATDAWNEYQADSLKKHIYDIASDAAGPNSAKYRQEVVHQVASQKTARDKAETNQAESERLAHAAEGHETRHHWLTAAAALLEIGIGVSSVSIITRQKLFWFGALAMGAASVFVFAAAWIV